MVEIITAYFQILFDLWKYDIEIFTWLFSNSFYWVVSWIPALIYLCFFSVKWLVLTVPLYMPFAVIIASGRKNREV